MVVQELVAKLGFQVDQQGLNKADQGLKSMAQSAALMYGAYRAAAAAAGMVVDSVARAATLEDLNVQFEVLLKNADAAKYLVQQINQFAAVTPFETMGLVAVTKQLMAFGLSANASMAALKNLGDVALGDQEKLGRLAYAYGQVMSAGKLQGQDLLQFINAGFNPLQNIAERTHKSMGQLKKDMEQGKISADMVKQAFIDATGPSGLFFQGMAKGAESTKGLWSTVLDNMKMMSAEFGQEMLPFIKKVLVAFIELTPMIGDAFRNLGDFFRLLFAGGPSAEEWASGLAAAFMTVADGIMLLGTAFQLFKFLFIKAANEMAAEAWGIVDALSAIPKTAIRGFKVLAELGYAAHGKTVGNSAEDTRKYSEEMSTYSRWYDFMGGDRDHKAAVRDSAKSEDAANWQKFMDLGAMIGQSRAADPNAKVKMTDDIMKALEGKAPPVITTNVNTTIYAEGSLKDILTEQANSILGLGFQTRLTASLV